MGIFDSIKGAIFGNAVAAEAPPAQPSPAPASNTATQPTAPTRPGPAPAAPTAPSSAPDIAAILDKAVAAKGQKLNWKNSIVDLMKALNIDSSLGARKELAHELNYTGDMNDTVTMNLWLHDALMKKLAENGGKLPSDLAA
ncbi:MAG: DUF3597 domain-containing protein [Mesorhizobium sp.]|uniref:DUF3597 domain-containing protein n=1 Tax=Mesorhizobium sp. TaxID=1871066 RepID=UPI0011FCBD4D|nr:DUF3597 domain-containing protein [Mesorhizobium sp.]TIT22970.1 MAG: DUF3597 domain-containing protein [Mesorhizobium sp.]